MVKAAINGLLQKAALWPMALWPCGLRFFIVLLPIIQHRCTHPGFTGSMQAAKAAYRLHIISASCAQCSDQSASAMHWCVQTLVLALVVIMIV